MIITRFSLVFLVGYSIPPPAIAHLETISVKEFGSLLYKYNGYEDDFQSTAAK